MRYELLREGGWILGTHSLREWVLVLQLESIPMRVIQDEWV